MVPTTERFHCIQDSQLGPNGVHYREVSLYNQSSTDCTTLVEGDHLLHTNLCGGQCGTCHRKPSVAQTRPIHRLESGCLWGCGFPGPAVHGHSAQKHTPFDHLQSLHGAEGDDMTTACKQKLNSRAYIEHCK